MPEIILIVFDWSETVIHVTVYVDCVAMKTLTALFKRRLCLIRHPTPVNTCLLTFRLDFK